MPAIFDTLTVLAAVLPADINITPNDSGLPGIGALRTVVGAVMTIGLILSVLASNHLGRGVGVRIEHLEPALRRLAGSLAC